MCLIDTQLHTKRFLSHLRMITDFNCWIKVEEKFAFLLLDVNIDMTTNSAYDYRVYTSSMTSNEVVLWK